MYGSQTEKIKWFPRLGIYKNSTGNVTFNPTTMEAYSYNWWQFVRKIGKTVIFNDYYYSSSTNAHQWCVKSVLKEKKIRYITVSIRDSLHKLNDDTVKGLYQDMFKTELQLGRMRSKWRKNKAKKSIKSHQKMIDAMHKLGYKLTKVEIAQCKKWAIESDTKARSSQRRHKTARPTEEQKAQLADLSPVDFKMNELNDLGELKSL